MLADGWIPVSLHFSPSQPTTVQFDNGKEVSTSCLRCPDTPCARFSDDEIVFSSLEGFPADKNSDVCAAEAISLSNGSGTPIIDSERCLLCGVCSTRCPVGAIRLVPGQGAIIDDSVNIAFVEIDELPLQKSLADRKLFENLSFEGSHLIENDAIIDEVFSKLGRTWSLVGDKFPNLLARNLLIGAGVNASLRRKGNNHMRMDLILSSPNVNQGIAEVEFGQEAVLDAPRDTLDALAVLVSRYGWKLHTTSAIIVSDVLPNRRSEYWHIIQDIANVFGVRLGSITIFGLILFNWNRLILNLAKNQPFYADRKTKSYRTEILEPVIGRALHVSNSPRSQIDIAK